MTEIQATFATQSEAQSAAEILAKSFLDVVSNLEVAPPSPVLDTVREGRTMARIVVIIVLASVLGTIIGGLLGIVLHLLVGPKGTSGFIIQAVSSGHLLPSHNRHAGGLLPTCRSHGARGRPRPACDAGHTVR